MEERCAEFRKKLKLGVPAEAIASQMRRAGLDPAQIPELGHTANITDPNNANALKGKQLLAAAFKPRVLGGVSATGGSRPKKWVVKTEAELPPIKLGCAAPYPLVRPLNAQTGWDAAVSSIKRSALGATGVFFVLLSDNDSADSDGVLVLKRVPDLDSALYEGAFPTMLSLKLFGIKTPRFRVLPRDDAAESGGDNEFKQFKRGIFALYKNQGFDPPSGVQQLFDAPALVMTELVVGVPLCHKSAGQRPLLREDYLALGRIFVLDLVINNYDRLPCRSVWRRDYQRLQSQGNPGNLMFGTEPGDVVAIDHELLVAVEHKFDEYVGAVRSVVAGIVKGTDTTPLEDIVAYVSAHSGYESHPKAREWLEEGFLEGLRRARVFYAEETAEMNHILETVGE